MKGCNAAFLLAGPRKIILIVHLHSKPSSMMHRNQWMKSHRSQLKNLFRTFHNFRYFWIEISYQYFFDLMLYRNLQCYCGIYLPRYCCNKTTARQKIFQTKIPRWSNRFFQLRQYRYPYLDLATKKKKTPQQMLCKMDIFFYIY